MKPYKTFVKLDEDIFQDDKVRSLLKRGGFLAFGHYIGLLTVFRRYEDFHFRIPFDQISEVAEWDLHCKKAELEKSIELCLDVGLFQEDGEMFWSERRSKDLTDQLDKLIARRANAARSNEKRKANKQNVDNLIDSLIYKTTDK